MLLGWFNILKENVGMQRKSKQSQNYWGFGDKFDQEASFKSVS